MIKNAFSLEKIALLSMNIIKGHVKGVFLMVYLDEDSSCCLGDH